MLFLYLYVSHCYIDKQLAKLILAHPTLPQSKNEQLCYIFDELSIEEDSPGHLAGSLRLDKRVRKCAEILEKPFLNSESLNEDMIAQDAIYPRNSLTDSYKKANVTQLDGSYDEKEYQLHDLVFSELVERDQKGDRKGDRQKRESQIGKAINKIDRKGNVGESH